MVEKEYLNNIEKKEYRKKYTCPSSYHQIDNIF
jgi:hypothetical protein